MCLILNNYNEGTVLLAIYWTHSPTLVSHADFTADFFALQPGFRSTHRSQWNGISIQEADNVRALVLTFRALSFVDHDVPQRP